MPSLIENLNTSIRAEGSAAHISASGNTGMRGGGFGVALYCVSGGTIYSLGNNNMDLTGGVPGCITTGGGL